MLIIKCGGSGGKTPALHHLCNIHENKSAEGARTLGKKNNSKRDRVSTDVENWVYSPYS